MASNSDAIPVDIQWRVSPKEFLAELFEEVAVKSEARLMFSGFVFYLNIKHMAELLNLASSKTSRLVLKKKAEPTFSINS